MVTARIDQIFEDVINTIREPILVLDSDLSILFANQRFYDLFKVTPAETLGNLIGINPEKFITNENENMRRNGERVWVAWTNKAICDGNGKIIEILCIGNDITERRRLEILLSESEERFRRLFETANDGILLLEKREGNITHANPAVTAMFGYSKEECIGKKLQDIGLSHDMGDFQEVMQALDRSGIIYYDDVPIKTKAGQTFYVDMIYTWSTGQG